MEQNRVETNLLELYKELNRNRIDYNVRKWETVRFFESIFTALIVAFVGGFISTVYFGILDTIWIVLALASLPVCACIALALGIVNLKRESRLLFIEEGTMFKILKLVSIPDTVPENKRWIPNDEYLLPAKYRDYKYGIRKGKEIRDFEQWADLRTEGHRFSHIFNLLFYLEIGISAVLAIGIVCYYLFN